MRTQKAIFISNINTPSPLLPVPRSDGWDKTLIVLCHLSALTGIFSGFVLPFIVYLFKRKKAGPVAIQAKEALNFQLSLMLYVLCVFLFAVLSIPILSYMAILVGPALALVVVAIAVWSSVMGIVAAIKTSNGTLYRYPLCIRFIS